MNEHLFIKICGITETEDAVHAVRNDVDALGFVFAPSRRRITSQQAERIIRNVPNHIVRVGVFMDADLKTVLEIAKKLNLSYIQLHGSESPEFCSQIKGDVIKRIPITKRDTKASIKEKIESFHVFAFLLDPGAGDGEPFDWNLACGLPERIIIAGGLDPDNVREAVRKANPFGIDVSSGVEIHPGKKDPYLVKRFIEEARS